MTDLPALDPPKLTCYAIHADAPRIVPAAAQRDWMDGSRDRFAYRCIPLSIANASGWEILCPFDVEARWDGSQGKDAISVYSSAGQDAVERLAISHFGEGVLTFHVGYLFRTSPGWALWARGSPNTAKRRIAPLDGIIETDWLPFSFTMNWRFTRVGVARFAKDEPFCFLTLVPHAILDRVEPMLARLDDAPELKAQHETWAKSRGDFNAALAVNDPKAVAAGWQRNYVTGVGPDGARAGYHLSKRRLKAPKKG